MVVMLYNALMTTGAFSWNVSKLFSELKLVTNNLLFINVVLILHVSILYMYILSSVQVFFVACFLKQNNFWLSYKLTEL